MAPHLDHARSSGATIQPWRRLMVEGNGGFGELLETILRMPIDLNPPASRLLPAFLPVLTAMRIGKHGIGAAYWHGSQRRSFRHFLRSDLLQQSTEGGMHASVDISMRG